MNCFSTSRRFFSSVIKPKVCIVGAGPAGFYAAQYLVKKLNDVQIDIYEKLPVPFGLVRFGVAPDHPEVKNVINTFTKTAESKQVNFIGNVGVGQDITVKQLRDAYHVVLLTYGAEESRTLNIPGENLKNVIAARNVVGWYNGTPWDANLDIDLSGETAAIFGQGNVAIDVARILLSPIDELAKTDITQHALEKLSKSNIKKINLIGRRGPLQAAFTIKELREVLRLKNCSTVWRDADFKGVEDVVPNLARPKKRITELMLSSMKESKEQLPKTFSPIFFRSPLEVTGVDKVQGAVLGVTRLEGEDILKQRAILTDSTEEINCDLVVSSIGYKSKSVDDSIPFDFKSGIVVNEQGRIDKGFYTTGWLATGPTGVILTTMSNAFGTADLILRDVEKDNLISENKSGFNEIEKTLQSKNVQLVHWKDWMKIDEYEQKNGEKLGKPREKIIDINEMLKIAAS